MAQIDLDSFATASVVQALFFGVNSHYTVALALLRSKKADGTLSDEAVNDAIGPYMINQDSWDAGCVANDLEIVLQKEQVTGWRFQCIFAALNAYRSQCRFLDRLGRYPSALELYGEQWPGEAAPSASEWQSALDRTRDLVAQTLEKELEDKPLDAAMIDRPDNPIRLPTLDPTGPEIGTDEKVFVEKAPGIMEKLVASFDIQNYQAAGILGNLGYESNGLRILQEVLAPGSTGRGGLGWAQWSGARRTAFEAFCADQGLNATSDAANLGYLMMELRGPKKSSIDKVKTTINLSDAVRSFEKDYEAAAVKRYPLRERWATLALDSFSHQESPMPPAVTRLLDPDLTYRVIDRMQSGGADYWLIDQIAEHGDQVLIEERGSAATVLAQGAGFFPLPSGLVPADVEKKFDEEFTPPPPETDHPISFPSNGTAARIFAEAKEESGRLVTHDVPQTNHGHLACAWAVNEVVKLAIGKPIGGGLSSDRMADVLEKNHTRLEEADIVPGAIIICPSTPGNTGHVGIIGDIGAPRSQTDIYSNSSSRGVFMKNYSLASWQNYFRGRHGLEVRYYLVKV
jgi:Phage tail lysozyme